MDPFGNQMSRRTIFRSAAAAFALATVMLISQGADARKGKDDNKGGREDWAATWIASAHGTYPTGTAVNQPDLTFAFGLPEVGANDQTFRLIVRPNIWSDRFRLRFTNKFGDRPVTFDGIYLGLHESGGAVVEGTNQRVTFGGKRSVTLQPGEIIYSDPIHQDYADLRDDEILQGRKLAVSFHAVGTTGPMTWHSKAVQTSYVSPPGSGSHGHDETALPFPYTTTSWYFLDGVDALASADTKVLVALGDSITDGTGSTLNGDDRYPDFLSRRVREVYGDKVSVVNAGVGGNRILTDSPAGGPAALERLDEDVFSHSGVSAVIWLEGTNDLGNGAVAEEIIAGIRDGVRRMRAEGLKVIQATVTSTLGAANAGYGTPETDAQRKAVNEFIRTADIFDSVADFDAVTTDPATGELLPQYQPNSTTAVIDKIHPNRPGYLAMSEAVDIRILAPKRHAYKD
ncbi:GDSL-type esterase/lipase family protein [Indioceanicola profundi]|uniref:GDSL-type esterase/lipase family protein n=1 Tax=Indioceanicola profundi TaxID=2220096 RepID=UPI001CEC3E28|nr:GDSL-type esterase/lipase family protein [Indioceanicola profundi]